MLSVLVLALLARVSLANPGGCVGTIAGVPLHDPVEGAAARGSALSLTHPAVVDPASPGSVIIPVSGAVIRVGHGGFLTKLAGRGDDTVSSVVLATSALLRGPTLATVDFAGVIVADQVSIRRLDSSGRLRLIAGDLAAAPGNRTSPDGVPAMDARLGIVQCLHTDAATGDIYFCEGSGVVRVIRYSTGLLATVAGNGSLTASVDGVPAVETGFSDIRDVYVAPGGDVLVAENDNYMFPRVVRISASDGIARTIAGSTTVSASGTVTQNLDSAYFVTGAPASTPLVGVVSVYVQASTGTVFFCDNTRIGALTAAGTLTVVAGLLPSASAPVIDGGLASDITFVLLAGLRQGSGPDEIVVVDVGSQNVYRLDLTSQRVVAIAGPVQLVPLTPALTRGLTSELLATDIPLPGPYDVTVDAKTGDVYAALASGDAVVKVSSIDGTMTVLAGTGYPGCAGDDVSDATLAPLIHPTSLSLDGFGGLVIADRRCCLLRRLDMISGLLTILAGNVSALCRSPVSVSPLVPPGIVEDASPVVHELYYAVVNQVTGDIFWTEDLSRRVLVLRSGASQPMRIAGTGAEGIDAGGVVDPGAIALNTALAVPSSITLDSSGDPVFLDGYSPGRILRILPSGALMLLAAIQRSASVHLPVADGMLASATAYSLSGLAFVDGGTALLVADTTRFSLIRKIDFVSHTITTVLGASSGDASDGTPLLGTVCAFISAITVLPGGGILFADGGANILRIGIPETANFTICPAGYTCPCGTPEPCNLTTEFCPANTQQPLQVERGFFAVARTTSIALINASALPRFVEQASCRVGFYCSEGIERPCPAGTYGLGTMQAYVTDCYSCPAGTYNAVAGATSAASCLPCPPGSFADTPGSALCTLCPPSSSFAGTGGNSSSLCVPCPPNFASLPGTRLCTSLGSAKLSASGSVVVVRSLVPLADATVNTLPLVMSICIPIAVVSVLPSLILVILIIFAWCFHRKDAPAKTWILSFNRVLRSIDMYSLRHKIKDGNRPVKLTTSLGGAITVLAVGAMACLAVSLVVDFAQANVLMSASLLPAELPTLSSLAGVRTHAPSSEFVPLVFSPKVSRGIELRVVTQGPDCGNPSFEVSALLAGRFVSHVVPSNRSAMWELSYACEDCALGPLTSIDVRFPPSCQSFLVTAVFFGAAGSVSGAAATSSGSALSSMAVTFKPQLEVLNDPTSYAERGYILGDVTASEESRPSSEPFPFETVLTFDLSVRDTYTLVKSVPIRTATQLLSSVIGLTGLLLWFGLVFVLMERLCLRTWRVVQQRHPSVRWTSVMQLTVIGQHGVTTSPVVADTTHGSSVRRR